MRVALLSLDGAERQSQSDTLATPSDDSENHSAAGAAATNSRDGPNAAAAAGGPSSLMLAENMEAADPQKLRAKRDLDADEIRQLLAAQNAPSVDDYYSQGNYNNRRLNDAAWFSLVCSRSSFLYRVHLLHHTCECVLGIDTVSPYLFSEPSVVRGDKGVALSWVCYTLYLRLCRVFSCALFRHFESFNFSTLLSSQSILFF